ncbi:MAG TPA: DUF4139 domain-containing protein, partial [Nannocystaceae bacterium]|nr:DUF4139 domain-containing protein [Nannocystaceae bacterium]
PHATMNVTSTLESVVIYREGAICTRTTAVAPPAGQRVRIVGLPLALGAASLRAFVRSGPPSLRVLDVRAAFDVELLEEIDVAEESRLLEVARDAHARLQLRFERLEQEIAELRGLAPRFLEPRRGDPPREAPVAAMLELAELVDGRLAVRLEARRTLARELEDAAREEQLRVRRLAEASSAKTTSRARVTRAAIVTLSDALVQPIALALEYQIAAARWAPSYRLRLDEDGKGGRLAMRAAIAQATGEDWTDVAISLSTAALARRTDLPELRALRIGRSQPEPPRAGWREPPPGLDALFDAYDGARALRQPPRPRDRTRSTTTATSAPPRPSAPPPPGGVAGFGRPSPPPPPAAAPMAPLGAIAASAPAPMRASMDQLQTKTASPRAGLTQAGAARSRDAMLEQRQDLADDERLASAFAIPTPATPVPDAAALDYDRLTMTGPDPSAGPRGRLVPAPSFALGVFVGVSVQIDVVIALVEQANQRAHALAALPVPPGSIRVASVDEFDYRYDCATPLDVPSTATWVTVPVMDCRVGLRPRFVCVPSVEAKVYRTLEIANDTAHALLPGPVDVGRGEQFLLTTSLPPVPPGAKTERLGLGVEEALEVARKTTFKETSGGLLGGSTVLPHEVSIEIDNRLAVPADLEVRERIPVVAGDEKDIKIEEQDVRPAWETVDEPLDGVLVPGTRRWRVTIPARDKTTLVAQFAIRIPADRVLVGGNRRT